MTAKKKEEQEKNIVTMTLRVPRQLREKLKKEAGEKGLSLNELIILKLNPLSVEFRKK